MRAVCFLFLSLSSLPLFHSHSHLVSQCLISPSLQEWHRARHWVKNNWMSIGSKTEANISRWIDDWIQEQKEVPEKGLDKRVDGCSHLSLLLFQCSARLSLVSLHHCDGGPWIDQRGTCNWAWACKGRVRRVAAAAAVLLLVWCEVRARARGRGPWIFKCPSKSRWTAQQQWIHHLFIASTTATGWLNELLDPPFIIYVRALVAMPMPLKASTQLPQLPKYALSCISWAVKTRKSKCEATSLLSLSLFSSLTWTVTWQFESHSFRWIHLVYNCHHHADCFYLLHPLPLFNLLSPLSLTYSHTLHSVSPFSLSLCTNILPSSSLSLSLALSPSLSMIICRDGIHLSATTM